MRGPSLRVRWTFRRAAPPVKPDGRAAVEGPRVSGCGW